MLYFSNSQYIIILFLQFSMLAKQINIQQSLKLLKKLYKQDSQSYQNFIKMLNSFEKSDFGIDCYIEVNCFLLGHIEITKEINQYLDEQNKFVINKSTDERVNDFVELVKKARPQIHKKISKLISSLRQQNKPSAHQKIKSQLKELVKGDPDLQRAAEQALDLTVEQLIRQKKLEHIKPPNISQGFFMFDKEKSNFRRSQPKRIIQTKNKNLDRTKEQDEQQPKVIIKQNIQVDQLDQKDKILRRMLKVVDKETYNLVNKIIDKYLSSIITQHQAQELLEDVKLNLNQRCRRDLKQLFDKRQKKKKANWLKPIEEMDFTNVQRVTPSYVPRPHSNFSIASGKTDFIKSVINESLASVTKINKTRLKQNQNLKSLFESQDRICDEDAILYTLRKILQILDKVLDENNPMHQAQKQKLIKAFIGMIPKKKMFQLETEAQKQQYSVYIAQLATSNQARINFRQKVGLKIKEMQQEKDIAGKLHEKLSQVNFLKSLQQKQPKFNVRQNINLKDQVFTYELRKKREIVQNGGYSKTDQIFYEQNKLFTVFNSFQSLSRAQKCNSNSLLPQIQTYDLKEENNRRLYPLNIFSFNDKSICQRIYHLLTFYIESLKMGKGQIRCRVFLEQFLVHFLGWRLPPREQLSEKFDINEFYQKLDGSWDIASIKQLVSEKQYQMLSMIDEKDEEQEQKKKMAFLMDQPSKYSYLPLKSQERSVLYGSEKLYSFVRFLYTIYQRLIKLEEVAKSTQKVELFKIHFYACIHNKKSRNFWEKYINLGEHSYLFKNFINLFEKLTKSLTSVTDCSLTKQGWKIFSTHSQEPEDIHTVLINKFCLQQSLNNINIVRLVFDSSKKAIYVNHIDSYYKQQQGVSSKNYKKDITQLGKKIDKYTNDRVKLQGKKRAGAEEVHQKNELQYHIGYRTFRMMNHRQNQDLLINTQKNPINLEQIMKINCKRSYLFNQRLEKQQ